VVRSNSPRCALRVLREGVARRALVLTKNLTLT
jgi:hypothetical protein